MTQLHIQDIVDHLEGYLIRGGFNGNERKAIMMVINLSDRNVELYGYAVKFDNALSDLLSADICDETTENGRRNAKLIREEAYADMREALEMVLTHSERIKPRHVRFTEGKGLAARISKGSGILRLGFF